MNMEEGAQRENSAPPGGNTYTGITGQGNARMHVGNSINYDYSTTSHVNQVSYFGGIFGGRKRKQALLEAAKDGYVERLQALLRTGAEVDYKHDGMTAMHYAAENGHNECVKLLIQAGSHMDWENQNGKRPLDLAIANQHAEVVRTIVSTRGFQLGPYHARDKSFLTTAALQGNFAVFVALMSSPYYQTSQGRKDQVDALQDVFLSPNPDEREPLDEDSQRRVLFKRLLDDYLMTDNASMFLWMAVSTGRNDSVQALADRGVDLNNGGHWLDVAIVHEQMSTLHLLIKLGANLDTVNEDGFSPLHMAITAGNFPASKVLVEAGCNLDPLADGGVTPLHMALAQGSVECAQLLIKAGCNVDLAMDGDYTALHLAAGLGDFECVKALVNAGAKRSMKDELGEIPLMRARRLHGDGHPVVQYLEILESGGEEAGWVQVLAHKP